MAEKTQAIIVIKTDNKPKIIAYGLVLGATVGLAAGIGFSVGLLAIIGL
jgi:hypothetical protein